MKKINLLTVGKIKTSYWQEAADHYKKNLRNKLDVTSITVKDAPAGTEIPQRMAQEGEHLFAALTGLKGAQRIFCLDEYGDMMDSQTLAAMLEATWMQGAIPCFLIGGAYGLDAALRSKAHKLISLSRLTFTHEMAQVIFWEQLFRADSILRNSGYHHG